MEKTLTPDEPQSNNFLTKKTFSKLVEETVKKTGMNYIDTIVHLCEENKIEIEDIKKYLNEPIKDRLEAEAMGLNFIKNETSVLDV